MNNKGFPLKKICETPPEIESPPISCHKYTGCTIALRSSPLMPVERGAADIPIELKPRGGWGGG